MCCTVGQGPCCQRCPLLQANMRVNTPDAYDAYQNISTALSSEAASATEVCLPCCCRTVHGMLLLGATGGCGQGERSMPCS